MRLAFLLRSWPAASRPPAPAPTAPPTSSDVTPDEAARAGETTPSGDDAPAASRQLAPPSASATDGTAPLLVSFTIVSDASWSLDYGDGQPGAEGHASTVHTFGAGHHLVTIPVGAGDAVFFACGGGADAPVAFLLG